MRQYSRLLDTQHGTIANIGTEEAVLYTATAESFLRFGMMINVGTSDREISLHHWASGETACGDDNKFFPELKVMYSGDMLLPSFPVPGIVINPGEKIVANPNDALDGNINIQLNGSKENE